MAHYYNREVDITYLSGFNRIVVKIFPLFEHNIKNPKINMLSIYNYEVNNGNISIHCVEEKNSEIKSFSFKNGNNTDFYEQISKDTYYLIKYIKNKMKNMYIVKDYIPSEIFVEDIYDYNFVVRDLGDLKKDFETKKNMAYRILNKSKLCTYYNSLMTRKSLVHSKREITKSYENNVVMFMQCINNKNYNLPNELIYIIMKFIKFI